MVTRHSQNVRGDQRAAVSTDNSLFDTAGRRARHTVTRTGWEVGFELQTPYFVKGEQAYSQPQLAWHGQVKTEKPED